MTLDEVTSIKKIWEAAKSGGIIHRGNDTLYEYIFDGGERVAFSFELSLSIESDSDMDSYYAINKDLYIDYIKTSNAKGHVFLFTHPFSQHN